MIGVVPLNSLIEFIILVKHLHTHLVAEQINCQCSQWSCMNYFKVVIPSRFISLIDSFSHISAQEVWFNRIWFRVVVPQSDKKPWLVAMVIKKAIKITIFLKRREVSLGTKMAVNLVVSWEISWEQQTKMNVVTRMFIAGNPGIRTRSPCVSWANQMWYWLTNNWKWKE